MYKKITTGQQKSDNFSTTMHWRQKILLLYGKKHYLFGYCKEHFTLKKKKMWMTLECNAFGSAPV
jgi:hypothetical protein